ncbi:MAG: class I SAM-dependent methyltransferase [Bacteroidia bacterium]|nr:class I SAM-dependent methyltransferase [Bacteroidia bacterium]MDW8133652.1 class I SAM-dependent methyltransferase [Bacteroidia bacterium]
MKEWFDSPHYKLLYAYRDEREAEEFAKILLKRLDLPAGAYILDAGCGEGRYARVLTRMGYKVDAVDANVEAPNLPDAVRFFSADLTKWTPDRAYHLIGSFFTSFGIGMQQWKEVLQLAQRFSGWLLPGGWLLIDYLNIYLRNPTPKERKTIQGLSFLIERWQDAHWLYKRITVEGPQGIEGVYEEKVFKLTQGDLCYIAKRAGLEVKEFWGDYKGSTFQWDKSPRLILLARKPLS